MSTLDAQIKPALDSRRDRGVLRRLPSSTALRDVITRVDFSSNDYLSLATSPSLKAKFIEKIQGSSRVLGSGGSRLLDGGTLEHAELEERLANFFESPAALLYTSGYDANVGFFGSIPAEGDLVVYDELIHASVHDGMRTSRAARIPGSLLPFKHNDGDALRSVIDSAVRARPSLAKGIGSVFVAIESLYSMDGDIAPVKDICDIVEERLPAGNGHIVVDEAHATGIYGPQGRGVIAYLGLESRITARLHTFGKALASSGAVFLTSPTVREYLINYSRPQVFTTAISFGTIVSIHAVFDMLESGEYLPYSERLQSLARYFLQRFAAHRFAPELVRLPWSKTTLATPIVPLLSPYAKPMALYLRERGFLVRPITHPTVPKGRDRVRVCLHASNTEDQIDALLKSIQCWIDSGEDRRVVVSKL
ncbi:hypothetical protein FRC17_003237 [Serendipita sp. 399]|nr:hypothetical protein FRC17_003237 [Serendipita sp. 399]